MENPFKSIYKFNKEAGLLEKGYSDFLEPSFLIEEALEDLNTLPNLAMHLSMKDEGASPKEIAREIVLNTHLSAPLPHKMLVDGVAYNYGFSQTDGFVKFLYEEVE